jgi:hypothetical protein
MSQQQRNQYQNQVRSQLPRSLDSHMLDATINQVLNDQGSEVEQAFERGKTRGQLNDVGYQGAEKAFGTKKAAVQAKLQGTGYDLLDTYEGDLKDIRSQALDAASAYDLGETFNFDDYLHDANDVVSRATERLPGQLLGQIGDDPLFNISELLTKGGQAQGAQNLRNLDLVEALDRQKQRNAQGRGLGSQGAF